jgi:hypothetical protein
LSGAGGGQDCGLLICGPEDLSLSLKDMAVFIPRTHLNNASKYGSFLHRMFKHKNTHQVSLGDNSLYGIIVTSTFLLFKPTNQNRYLKIKIYLHETNYIKKG